MEQPSTSPSFNLCLTMVLPRGRLKDESCLLGLLVLVFEEAGEDVEKGREGEEVGKEGRDVC